MHIKNNMQTVETETIQAHTIKMNKAFLQLYTELK